MNLGCTGAADDEEARQRKSPTASSSRLTCDQCEHGVKRDGDINAVVVWWLLWRVKLWLVPDAKNANSDTSEKALLVGAAFDGLRLALSRPQFTAFAAATRPCEEYWRCRQSRVSGVGLRDPASSTRAPPCGIAVDSFLF
eukprot:4443696-Amphidinium_carterae.1